MPNRLVRSAAAALGGAAVMLAVAQQAGASDILDQDNVTLSPVATTYANGTSLAITKTGLAASSSYTVGQCEYTTYTSTVAGGAKVPACTNQTTVSTNAAGTLSVASYALVKTGSNVHVILGGAQPASVNCGVKLCEIVVSPAHGGGSGGSFKGDSAEFKVS